MIDAQLATQGPDQGDEHMESVELTLKIDRERCNWGVGDTYYRDVLVEPDGDVLAYDTVGHHYSRLHDLTDAEVQQAREMAAKVWAGTHFTAAGFLTERRA